MIIYFSGTGNSRYVADTLSKRIGDNQLYPLIDAPNSTENCDQLGIVTPIYSWGIPPIVLKQINQLLISVKTKYVWVVLVCGDEVGLAHKMIYRAFEMKDVKVDAIMSIQMPNNYVLLPGFNVDPKALERKKIEASAERIGEIVSVLAARKTDVEDVVKGGMAWLKTKCVYHLFKRWGIFPGKWHVNTNKCVGCGKCAKVCPVKNIKMGKCDVENADKKVPMWHKNCTSCLACYHICPEKAIDYLNSTKNKGQYYFSKC
jgi:ferredoxin/flavodoxin